MDYGYNMTYKFLVELEDEWKLAFAYSYTDDGRSAALGTSSKRRNGKTSQRLEREWLLSLFLLRELLLKKWIIK
jgi:hypothetical protein